MLQLTVHHIVADGWSLGVLSKELTDALRGVRGAAAATSVRRPPATRTSCAGSGSA